MSRSTSCNINSRFLGEIPYQKSWLLQKRYLKRKIDNNSSDIVLGCLHEPVITSGRMNQGLEGPVDRIPVYKIERGGKATYHGPGQLVCYFIWDIRPYGIKRFFDLLEDIICSALIKAGVEPGLLSRNINGRGVWIKDKKIASLGIAVKRWVSFHGISINIDSRVHFGFNKISPCGMESSRICCLEHFGIKTEAKELFDRIIEAACSITQAKYER